jgi:uncharacterized protein YcbK (DUF882 family)
MDTVDAELIDMLETIRKHFGKPITINSGCRCPAHNRSVEGADTSQHLYGRAADFTVADIPADDVYAYAEQIDAPGLGSYSTWTHIDSRVGFARW